MKKKIIPLLLLFLVSHVPHAASVDDADPPIVDKEEAESDTYVPLVQNYCNLMLECLQVDYLYNQDTRVTVPFHKVKKFDLPSLFRTNGAILYAIRLNQSRFAFCMGLGWSTLHYTFASIENEDDAHGKTYPRLKRESQRRTEFKMLKSKPGRVLLGSAIEIPFIDVLFRLRFNTVLDDPHAGFHSWLGFKVGIRRRASMIIKYKAYDDSEASSLDKGHFNLKRFTCGLQGGIGYSRFGLTGGFHFIPLFNKNEGPSNSDLLRPFSFSIYVDLL